MGSSLARNLDSSIGLLRGTYPSLTFSPEWKKKVVVGCLKIVQVMKNSTALNSETIKNGFICCGQHKIVERDTVVPTEQVNRGLAYSTVDVDVVLDQCLLDIKVPDKEKMKAKLPDFVAIMKERGRITDKELDDAEIVKLPLVEHINRDELVLWRQHSLLLTHEDTVSRFHDYLHQRYLESDPIQIQETRLRKQRENRIIKYEEKKVKIDQDRIAKELKEAEQTAEKLMTLIDDPKREKASRSCCSGRKS